MKINWDNGKSLETIKTLAGELNVKPWKIREAIDMYFDEEVDGDFEPFFDPYKYSLDIRTSAPD